MEAAKCGGWRFELLLNGERLCGAAGPRASEALSFGFLPPHPERRLGYDDEAAVNLRGRKRRDGFENEFLLLLDEQLVGEPRVEYSPMAAEWETPLIGEPLIAGEDRESMSLGVGEQCLVGAAREPDLADVERLVSPFSRSRAMESGRFSSTRKSAIYFTARTSSLETRFAA